MDQSLMTQELNDNSGDVNDGQMNSIQEIETDKINSTSNTVVTNEKESKNITNDVNPNDNNNNNSGDKKEDYINIKVVNSDENAVFFKLKGTTKLSKVMAAYSSRNGLDKSSIRFTFDGTRINDNDTPDSLEMENEDVIDAMVEQTGGGYDLNVIDEKYRIARDGLMVKVMNQTTFSKKPCVKHMEKSNKTKNKKDETDSFGSNDSGEEK